MNNSKLMSWERNQLKTLIKKQAVPSLGFSCVYC
jgi:hypothetical protein